MKSREDALKWSVLFKHLADGGVIQNVRKDSDGKEYREDVSFSDVIVTTYDIERYVFCEDSDNYCVREKDRYRPFASKEEFLSACQKKNAYAVLSSCGKKMPITEVHNNRVLLLDVDTVNYSKHDVLCITFEDLLNEYEFEDKSPCGIMRCTI